MASGTYPASPTNAAPVAFSLSNQAGSDPTGSGFSNAAVAANVRSAYDLQGHMSTAPYQGAVGTARSASGSLGVSGWDGDPSGAVVTPLQ